MIPVFTQLSVMGMINIPGMMVGQLVAGTPIMEAVIYQQCIMFMITASSMFGVIMSVAVSLLQIHACGYMLNNFLISQACLSILIDKDQTMRHDRIKDNKSIHHYFPTLKQLKYRIDRVMKFCGRTRSYKSVADAEPA